MNNDEFILKRVRWQGEELFIVPYVHGAQDRGVCIGCVFYEDRMASDDTCERRFPNLDRICSDGIMARDLDDYVALRVTRALEGKL